LLAPDQLTAALADGLHAVRPRSVSGRADNEYACGL